MTIEIEVEIERIDELYIATGWVETESEATAVSGKGGTVQRAIDAFAKDWAKRVDEEVER